MSIVWNLNLKFEKSSKSVVLFDSTFDEKLKIFFSWKFFESNNTDLYAIVETRKSEAIRSKDRTYYPTKLWKTSEKVAFFFIESDSLIEFQSPFTGHGSISKFSLITSSIVPNYANIPFILKT